MLPNNRKREPNSIEEFPFSSGRLKAFPKQSETIGTIFLTRPVVDIDREKQRMQAFGIIGGELRAFPSEPHTKPEEIVPSTTGRTFVTPRQPIASKRRFCFPRQLILRMAAYL